jgi:AcrR family transcriptional regulator
MPAPSHRRSDPLTDILLRPTADPGDRFTRTASGRDARATEDSNAPQSRSLISTARTHRSIVEAARRLVLAHGTRIAMGEIAVEAGVAKATLYNHFRAREDVLCAVMIAEIDDLVGSLAARELEAALVEAGIRLSEHPMLEALADETALLASLAQVDVRAAGWIRVAEAVEAALARRGLRGAPTILRWLSSLIIAPAERDDIVEDAGIIVAGLPPRSV